MRRKIILCASVVLTIVFCYSVVSCINKESTPYEKLMTELAAYQDSLECCLTMSGITYVSNKLKSLSSELENKKIRMNQIQQRNALKSLADMLMLGMIKQRIINRTDALKVNPTKEEMQELSQKCVALTHGDITQVDQIVKDFWKEKRGLN